MPFMTPQNLPTILAMLKVSANQEKMLTYIVHNPGATRRTIIEELHFRSPASAENGLSSLVKRNLVKTVRVNGRDTFYPV